MSSARRIQRRSQPKRALGYARVSSEEQARGSSLRDQQASIGAYAQSCGLSVSTYYVEAESAVHDKFESRVQMQRLMREAREGDLVICDKLDRWSRDPIFSYSSVKELLGRGVAMYFVSDHVDPSTSDGDSAMGFRILFAREEHKRIRERMVGTREILRDQGYYAEGAPPLGYRRPHPKGYKGVEKNVLEVVKADAETVRRAFRLCIAGNSLSQISSRVGLPVDQLGRMLKKRVYTGQIQNTSGEWIEGRHKPIIDFETFARAQQSLTARRHGGARPSGRLAETSPWFLRDVAVCGLCGARMAAAYAGPHEARRYYYRCAHKCTTRFVRVSVAEEAFAPLLLARLAELVNELGSDPAERATAAVDDTLAKRRKLQQRRVRYLEMYADGVVTRDAMMASVKRVDDELLQLAATTPLTSPLERQDVRRDMLRDVAIIERAWHRGDGAKRRKLVNHLAVKVGLVAGETPTPEWRSAEALVERSE